VIDSTELPAVLGGRPAFPEGPPDWPVPDEEVREALERAYRDGTWGRYHGGLVARLEERLAEYHGVPHAMTCGSGTFAVELALRALRVGPGDEVALAAYDYEGNFLSVHALGATPLLIDVDPANCCLDPTRLEPAIGPRTRALIVSHLHGGVVPMGDVVAVAERHGLRVVEDACQCPGAVVEGRVAGTWGDVGVLSFGGSKLLTAGRGGAILTRHADVRQRARLSVMRANLVCPLSELQAAVLLPQLDRLDARNATRAANAARLIDSLRNVRGLRAFTNRTPNTRPGWYKLGLRLDASAFGLPRDRLAHAARAEGVALDPGFRALHAGRSPGRYRAAGELTEAARAGADVLTLHHPLLLRSSAEIDRAAGAIGKLVRHAGDLATAVFGER
jgi:perosamine synthetase